MKRSYLTLLLGIFLLTACAPAPTVTPAITTNLTETIPPTWTPLPSITPAPATILSLTSCDNKAKGEIPEQLKKNFNTTISDLNNDDQPEILLIQNKDDSNPKGSIYLFSCINGIYREIGFQVEEDEYFLGAEQYEIVALRDLNQNKLPELVIKVSGTSRQIGDIVFIFEWNGENFVSVVKSPSNQDHIDIPFPDKVYIEDYNNDKLSELVWQGGIPPLDNGLYGYGSPWRLETHIFEWSFYEWEGRPFYHEKMPYKFSAPIYRFQAVHDADLNAAYWEFDDALHFYKQAIFDDKLDWWSKEKSLYLQEKLKTESEQTGKIIPTPIPDTNERIKLSAYAYFRMMLVHLQLSQPDEAQKAYDTLLQNYSGNDSPGKPYAEMATAFFEASKTAPNIEYTCMAAIAYAQAHPEILEPLGGNYHGSQGHYYQPNDVCPFMSPEVLPDNPVAPPPWDPFPKP